jgi:hypothetical protein
MTIADRTYAQTLADRAAALEDEHTAAADYADELCDELRAYADDPASVADIRAHLLTVTGLRDLAAADLEEARRLLVARDSSPAG